MRNLVLASFGSLAILCVGLMAGYKIGVQAEMRSHKAYVDFVVNGK